MNASEEGEWTFVPSKRRKTSKHNKSTNKKRERQLAKAKELHNTIHGDDDCCDHHQIQEDTQKSLIQTIEQCMEDLKACQSNPSATNFDMPTLIQSIQEASQAEHSDAGDNNKYQDDEEKRELNEIICYGIGNFYNSTSSKYNSPLIQLACVLVLRQAFAETMNVDKCGEKDKGEDESNDPVSLNNTGDNDSEHYNLSYEKQQALVPTVYFEPFIKPIEEKVLEYFHVQVLTKNEHGKRRIDEINVSGPEAQRATENTCARRTKPSTLFYMPHCPMRLYSNVLWANWDEDLLMNGRIVLFGNSFKAYDERIISSDLKKDKTNAVFPLLNFVNEVPVLNTQGKRIRSRARRHKSANYFQIGDRDGRDGISSQVLEMAFNDSVVISFSNDDEHSFSFPDHPDEFLMENLENGIDSEVI